jgi:hypothetical protein
MATKTKEAPTLSPKMSAVALVAAMAGKAQSKKGSREAKPTAVDPSMDATIEQWINADQEEAKWKSIKATAEAQLLEFGRKARVAACRKIGKVESTIRLNGKLNMTAKCQYSKIPIGSEDKLREVFGDSYDQYFLTKTDLSLNEAAVNDPQVLQELVEAIGADKFNAWFTALQVIEVTESFHTDVTLKPAIEEKAKPLIESEIIKPYKASFRQ